MTNEEKILNLIQTGTDANLKLAFQLIKSTKIKIDFSEYEALFEWLLKTRRVKKASRIQTKIKRILEIKFLDFNGTKLPLNKLNFKLLYNLEAIHLKGEELGDISDLILASKKLKSLSVRTHTDYSIREIPQGIGQLHQLEYLSYIFNAVEFLPDSIGNLSNLKQLHLHRNKLGNVNPVVGNLSNLTHLDLCTNTLKTIPESFGQLHQLEVFNLSFNPITYLPECIKELKQLRHLGIYHTQISHDEYLKIKEALPAAEIAYQYKEY